MISSATKGAAMSTAEIGIRVLTHRDRERLERLAERDSARTPEGPVLGATVDGELVAALSLSDGEALADPFVRTDDVRALLADRAAQLRGEGGKPGSLLARLRQRRARAALPASPPGAGGRLLEI